MLLRILCLFSLVSSLVALSPSNERILGGNYVTIDQAPWHAIVLYQSTPGLDVSTYSYETSGAIIKDNVVVVPARFVDDATRYRKVRAGSNGALVLGQIAEVKEIVFHEQYDGNTYEYNVAIVVLEAAYKLTDLISTISFVGQDVVYPDGTYASITGYGVMGLPGNPSWWLQIIEIPLVNREVCSNFYSSYNIPITEQNICAGFLDNIGFSPCYLDGGGPLVIGGELIGLFERHWNCGLNGDPSIHVNIAAFSNWLKEKIESA